MKEIALKLGAAIAGMLIICNVTAIRSITSRIERLEDRSSRMTEHINFEIGHGIKWAEIHSGLTAQQASNLWFAYQFHITNAFVTNTLTISNASERTIEIRWPKPAVVYPVTEAKEDKP